jgi:hypothetical protein
MGSRSLLEDKQSQEGRIVMSPFMDGSKKIFNYFSWMRSQPFGVLKGEKISGKNNILLFYLGCSRERLK